MRVPVIVTSGCLGLYGALCQGFPPPTFPDFGYPGRAARGGDSGARGAEQSSCFGFPAEGWLSSRRRWRRRRLWGEREQCGSAANSFARTPRFRHSPFLLLLLPPPPSSSRHHWGPRRSGAPPSLSTVGMRPAETPRQHQIRVCDVCYC